MKENYRKYNEYLKKVIHSSKALYFSTTFNKFKNDIKNTWDTIRALMSNKSIKKQLPTQFKLNETLIIDDRSIADQFNNFFISIGNDSTSDQTNNNTLGDVSDYLKLNITSRFNFNHVTCKDVSDAIGLLQPKNSSGHDGLSMGFLKKITHSILYPLSLVFNQSLFSGIYPSDMKLAKIKPVYKKGDRNIFDNYRPISLLPSFSKNFEKDSSKDMGL